MGPAKTHSAVAANAKIVRPGLITWTNERLLSIAIPFPPRLPGRSEMPGPARC